MAVGEVRGFLVTLARHRTLFRSFWHTKDPTAFTSGSLLNPWRFTPFEWGDAKEPGLVQGLYLGDSPLSCLAETVFRKEKTAVVSFDEINGRNICEIRLQRDVLLCALTTDFFKVWGFSRNPVSGNDYRVCTEVAKAVHALLNDVDGLCFPGYQSDGANQNIVLFSDRVLQADIRAMAGNNEPVLSPAYRSDLLMAANRARRELSQKVKDVISGKEPYARQT